MSQKSPLYDMTVAAGAVFAERAGWLLPVRYADSLAEYRAACDHAALFDLSARGKIELAGKDAVSFLHNLASNDIKNLTVGAGCEAFLTTAKARTVGHVFVSRLSHEGRDVLWLDTDLGMGEQVLRHLDHYLISEQVEPTDMTADWAFLHLCGPDARQALDRSLTESLPDLAELQHVTRSFGGPAVCHVRRHDSLGLPGYDLFCPRSSAEEAWRALTNVGAMPAGLDAYEVLRVEAGQPLYGAEMDENRFVVEVGRTAQAICYTKGCYLGQEPIVMARDRGQVNRTLLGLKIREGGAVPAGAKLLHNGQEVGQVTSSVVSPRVGSAIALAYLRRGSQQPGTIVEVQAPEGSRLAEVVPLPFVVVP